MKIKEFVKNEYENLKKDNNKNFSLALLFATIILFVYCYFGSFSFFEKTFPNINNVEYWKIIYHNLMAFVLFFGIGTLFTKLVLKEELSNFGITTKGNGKLILKICLIALPIAMICGLSCVLDSGMTLNYPLINFSNYPVHYIIVYFVSYFLYYVGWEFLFRGILYFAGEVKCGALTSILITTLISALIHTSIGGFGKPMIETLSAIPAGLIFGYMAYKTRSIYPSLFAHIIVGFSTDIFIFLLA